MYWRKKVEAGISIFLIITLILSVSPSVNSEQISNLNTDTGEPNEQEVREFSVFSIDIKVRNEDSGIIEWTDVVDAYVGDIISFNIKISNICNFDFVNLQVVDIVDSPEILSYVVNSAHINGVYFEPGIQINVDETLLTWNINKFLANEDIDIIFNMIANHETEVDGVRSSVRVTSKLDIKYYEKLVLQKNILKDKESELLQILTDISDQQFIHDGLVVDLDKLILRESQLVGEIIAVSDIISLRESEAVIIESNINILSSEIETMALDKTGRELELSDLQILISEKQAALQVKNDLVIQLQADLDFELEKLSLLQDEFDLAIQNADISYLTIQDLENKISVEEELKRQMIQKILEVEAEIVILNNELNILIAQDAQLEDEIAANLDKQNQLFLVGEALQVQYQNIINEIEMLISEKDLKILNQEDIQVEIAYNKAVEQGLIKEIESLVIIENLLSTDIVSIENDLVVQYELLDLYQLQLGVVEGELDAITADLSKNVEEYLLVVDEIADYEILKQNKIDSISFIQLELGQYQIELNQLYTDLNDAYTALDLNDDIVSNILAEINGLEDLSDLQVNIISTAEDELNSIISRIEILQGNELLIAIEISGLEAELSNNIQLSKELNVQINNLQSDINDLNEDILIGIILQQDLQAQIFDKQQVLYGVENEISNLLNEESSLISNINLQIEKIGTNFLEKVSFESEYQTVLTDIGSLNTNLNYKIEALQLLEDQLSVAQIQQQEKTDYIDLQNSIISQQQGELVALNDDLNTAYNELEGNDVVVVGIQNQIDAKLELIVLQNQIIDAAVSEAATIQGEIDQLIELEYQLQAEIDLLVQQIDSNNQEILSVSLDVGNIVDSISSKELEVASLDDEILIAQDDLGNVNQNLDAKVQELDNVKGDISVEQNLLQEEVARSVLLDNKKTSLEGELAVLQKDQEVLLEETSENRLEIDSGDLEIQAIELEIYQVTRDIEDCIFDKERIVVNIDGLLVEKNQVESEIDSLSTMVIQKELVIDDLVLDQSGLIAEIEQLNIDKTNAESLIQSKIAENDDLITLKNIKIDEKNNVVDLRNSKEILYQEIVDNLAVYNTLLAQYEGELAQLYDERNAAIQETQGTNDVISSLINSINSVEDQIAQRLILRDAAVAEQNLLNSVVSQLNIDITSITADIAALNIQISEKQIYKSGLESEISDIVVYLDLLSAEKIIMEASLQDKQILLLEKQEAASILRVDIEALEYQEGVVSADLVSYEGFKSQKNSEKELLVAEYENLLLLIDSLFVQKNLKIDEQNALLAQIASEQVLKQDKIDDIALQNLKYDQYQDELTQLYSDLDVAVLNTHGSSIVISDLQISIGIKEGFIAEKNQDKTFAEAELDGIIGSLDVLYAQKSGLAYVISGFERQKTEKNLEGDSLILSIASVNEQIILLDNDKDIKAQELIDIQSGLNNKQSDLLKIQSLLNGLYAQDSSLSVDIAGLETVIENKQLLRVDLEADIASNQNLLNTLNSEYENKIAEQNSLKMQIFNKESFLDMKASNLVDYNELLYLSEQKLIVLNDDLDIARLAAASEDENINSLLDQMEIQDVIVKQKSQGIQIERDYVDSLGSEIGSYLVSEQILIQSIQVLNEQLLSKQQDLTLLEESYHSIELDIGSLVLQKSDFEFELANLVIDKTNNIELIEAEIAFIQELLLKKVLLDDEIHSLNDSISVLEHNISFIEDHNFREPSVLVYVSINPDDLIHEIDIKNYVWNDNEDRWDNETEVILNEPVKFKITITNNDDMIFEKVIVENYLPLGILEYQTGNINSDEPDIINGNILIWNIEKLEIAEIATIGFEASAIAEGFDYNIVSVFIDSVFITKDRVTVDVLGIPNQPPVAVNDSFSTNEDISADFDVLFNDHDSDDGSIDPTTVEIVDDVSHGITSIDPSTGVVTYLPSLDYHGVDSFTYTVDDDDGAVSNVATVIITVDDVNDPPVAEDDSAWTLEDTAVEIDVLDNDYDSDYPAGAIIDPTTVEIVDIPLNGSVTVNHTTGVISFSPNPGFIGTNSFSYTVKDTDSAISNIAIVTIEVKEDEEEIIYNILSKPEAGKIFFFDREPLNIGNLAEIFAFDSIVVGKITVEVEVDVIGFNTERVEFFLDDESVGNSTLDSFNLTIDQFLFGVYNLKVVAYDGAESISQERKVLFINLGLFANR